MGEPTPQPEQQKQAEIIQQTQREIDLQKLVDLFGGDDLEGPDRVLNLTEINREPSEKEKNAYEMLIKSSDEYKHKVEDFLNGPQKDSVLGKHLAELMQRLIAKEGEKTKEALKSGVKEDTRSKMADALKGIGFVPQAAQEAGAAVAKSDDAKPAADKPKDVPKSAADVKEFAKKASEMGLGELMMNLFKSFGDLMKSFGGSKKALPEVARKVEGFKPGEKKNIALDLKKGEKEKFKGPDDSVKYVAGALNLPVRENAADFLESFTQSGFILESSKDDMEKMFNPDPRIGLQVGDVLFFDRDAAGIKTAAPSAQAPAATTAPSATAGKPAAAPASTPAATTATSPGKPSAAPASAPGPATAKEVYLTAIVSGVDNSSKPPIIKFKTVFSNNAEPVERQIDTKDPLFKENFKGYIKVPQTRLQQKAAPAATP